MRRVALPGEAEHRADGHRWADGGHERAVGHIAREKGLDEPGYRILANHGRDGRQEVPHFHMHIFGGTDLGIMIKTSMG